MIRPEVWRQTLILVGVSICSLSDGYIFGQMSGMVAALAQGDGHLKLTEEQISWIAATINGTCICGFGLASVLADRIGRKRSLTILTTPIILVWIMLYFAQDFITFITSRILVGFCFGGVISIMIIATGEYTSPNVRGFWLNIVNSAATAVGTTLGHILGFFFHWRTVALIGIIPTGISAILPCFWVESPSWLAEKGRYKECEASFKALHGHKPDSENELQLLLQVEKIKKTSGDKSSQLELTKVRKAIRCQYFWEIAILTAVINVYRVAGSKVLFSTLAVTMLQEMTGRKDILFFTLLVDGFLVLGAFVSCYLIRKMKMRSLLFSTGIFANVFLFALSACMYFKPADDVYFPWINCTLLALYFISVNSGPYPVLETLFGEIYPLELKSFCIFSFGFFAAMLHFVIIKYSPYLFAAMGYHGVFLLNGIVMSLCLGYFWLRLPETKGRTLQEIELYFKNRTFDRATQVLNGEQVKVLI